MFGTNASLVWTNDHNSNILLDRQLVATYFYCSNYEPAECANIGGITDHFIPPDRQFNATYFDGSHYDPASCAWLLVRSMESVQKTCRWGPNILAFLGHILQS